MNRTIDLAPILFLLPALVLVPACGGGDLRPPEDALERIDAGELAERTRTLSSDEFEGRGPATRGEELTVEYLTGAFDELGLEPGNGSAWTQPVPLVSITADPSMRLRIEGDAPAEQLRAVVERSVARSAVFDMLTNGTAVSVQVETA